MSSLTIIGAPTSAGAYAPGQEKAPAAFRRHWLIERLAERRDTRDLGDIAGFRWRPDPERPDAMNLEAVRNAAAAVADHVAEAMDRGDRALVLGGDCTVELGTVAGALRGSGSVGLVYIDLDTDLNTPATSDGALDWTGTAHMLDVEGSAAQLSGMGPRRPLLGAGDIFYLAAENISAPEAETIRRLGLALLPLAEAKADPAGASRKAVQWGTRFDRLLVHLDVDVLQFTDFPIAENVRRRAGLRLAELTEILSVLLQAPNWRALTLTEINPDHAPDEAESFGALIAMLDTALPRSS